MKKKKKRKECLSCGASLLSISCGGPFSFHLSSRTSPVTPDFESFLSYHSQNLGGKAKLFWILLLTYACLTVLGLHCCAGFPLVAASENYFLSQCAGFSSQGLLLLRSTGFRAHGRQEMRHVGSIAVVSGTQGTGSVIGHAGLVAPGQVTSSWTRNQSRNCCVGRRILYHRSTREALDSLMDY